MLIQASAMSAPIMSEIGDHVDDRPRWKIFFKHVTPDGPKELSCRTLCRE
jgi:hypothetical protein